MLKLYTSYSLCSTCWQCTKGLRHQAFVRTTVAADAFRTSRKVERLKATLHLEFLTHRMQEGHQLQIVTVFCSSVKGMGNRDWATDTQYVKAILISCVRWCSYCNAIPLVAEVSCSRWCFALSHPCPNESAEVAILHAGISTARLMVSWRAPEDATMELLAQRPPIDCATQPANMGTSLVNHRLAEWCDWDDHAKQRHTMQELCKPILYYNMLTYYILLLVLHVTTNYIWSKAWRAWDF